MVNAMIDECSWENQESIFKNENRNHIQLLELKRRNRINKSYLEIEYGYKAYRDWETHF